MLTTATWYADPDGHWHDPLAHRGLVCVCEPGAPPVPAPALVLAVFISARFLSHVSRIELSLVPTHPDRVGGLGFLADTGLRVVPPDADHGALLAGLIGNRIFYLGARLLDFEIRWQVVLAFMLSGIRPLVVFAGQLARRSEQEVAGMARSRERYLHSSMPVAAWWSLRRRAIGGDGDIQSLADLANSVEVVRTMRLIPVTKEAILWPARRSRRSCHSRSR